MRRQHKYGAVATEVDGIRFASKKEARRYGELKLLEKAGEIRDLELQPRYPLHSVTSGGGRQCVTTYVGDFRYIRNGYRPILDQRIVEDVKGVRTAMYMLKRKMLAAEYGITITEV